MLHPNEETLLQYRFETLDPAGSKEVSDHLRTCTECAGRFAVLGKKVERLNAYDAEAELDEQLVARVLALAKAKALAAKPEATAASAAAGTAPAASPEATSAAEAGPEAAPAADEPPDDSVRNAEREVPGFLAWLGLMPGTSFQSVRRVATLSLIGVAALLVTGNGYMALREVKIDTQVNGERSFVGGGQSLTQVTVLNKHDNRGLKGATVKLELVAGERHWPLFEGQTDSSGVANAGFKLPEEELPNAELVVTATGRGEVDVVRQAVTVARDQKVHLSTDKPLYQPGQTIHARALALSAPSLVPAAGSSVVFELVDSKGTRLAGKTVAVSRFGIAAYSLELSSELALGEYTLRAKVGLNEAEVPLKVSRYTLPKFKLTLTGTQDSFLAGETLRADLRARYFFGKPIDGGEVRAVLTRPDGSLVAPEFKGKTSNTGELTMAFELPSSLAAAGPESLSLQVEVKDAAGEQEAKQQGFVVAREPLALDVVTEAGGLVAGVDNTVYVLTTTPEGKPLPCEVRVSGSSGPDLKGQTTVNGVGGLTLPAAVVAEGTMISVEATCSEGQHARKSFQLPRAAGPLAVRTDRALYRPGEAVTLTFETQSGTVNQAQVQVRRDGRIVHSQALLGQQKKWTGTLNLPAQLTGSLEIEVAQPGSRATVSRRIIVADPGGLGVKVTTDEDIHRPGTTAKLRFEVTDAAGKPKAAALGITVVDESLWALSSGNPAQARAFFLLERSLSSAKGPVSAPDLIKGPSWGEPEQLAARVLLANAGPAARVEAFSQTTFAAKEVQLQESKRDFNTFSDRATPWLVLTFILILAAALGRAASAWTGAGIITALTFMAMLVGRDTGLVLVVGFGALMVALVFHGITWGGFGWAYVAVPALCLVFFVTLFGDNIRRLFGMSADSLGGDARVMRRPYVVGVEKQMKNFGGDNDDFVAPKAVAEGMPAPAPAMAIPADPGADYRRGTSARDMAGKGNAPEPPRREVRVRQRFPETMFVHPELVTDESGVATLELPMADSITDWRLTALASSLDGALGTADAPLRVFQDFFVDLDAPVALVRGDAASMPIVVHNYLEAEQTVRLEVQAADWFEVVGPSSFSVKLAAGAVDGREVRIKVKKPGNFTFTVRADGTSLSDAVGRQLLVTEAGELKTTSVSGALKPDETVKVAITVPEATVPGSTALTLKVFSSKLASALSGLEGALQAPHGCFEQTSSTTYPNVLIWNYLKRTGQKNAAVEERAQGFVAMGYQRLLSFEVRGGGFEWFGRAPANQVLTAYGLMEFKDMSAVFPVDEKLISRTQDWLVSKQRGDGSWNPDASSLSDGLWKSGFNGQLMVTAYVSWSLAESGFKGNALTRAQGWLAQNLDSVNDAYTLALVTATFAQTGHPSTDAAVRKLVAMAVREKELASFAPTDATVYYSRGVGAKIEATALGAYALMVAKKEPELVRELLSFLATHRDASGAWHSTQGTVLALRALLLAAGSQTKDEELQVTVNGADAGKLMLKASADAPAIVNFAAMVKSGLNVIELTGKSDAHFQVVASWTQPWREKSADATEPLVLKVNYGRTKAEVGGIVPVDLQLTYRGEDASGMVVVSLGLPAGLAPLPEDLQGLVSAGKVARFELSADAVNLYLDRVATKAVLNLSLRLKARSKVDTKGQGSLAYLYYQPAVRSVVGATAMTIN